MNLFLSREEVRQLTGFAIKAKQIKHLRKCGIPFFVNGSGWPVVTVSAIEGRKQTEQPPQAWKPAVLQGGRIGA